ncbi:probable methyltransferase-like protein 24 isoform X2 [Haliotis rubra]|uniref:probable methyltransferase-like protein 24 isoform X2 n=1 Tax=Haliotis rubra TaxID=36100 RepID=UPI001EE52EA7|nr:probable methyltransferase-like protein 24 isoform X2 [Haliotis rubra]
METMWARQSLKTWTALIMVGIFLFVAQKSFFTKDRQDCPEQPHADILPNAHFRHVDVIRKKEEDTKVVAPATFQGDENVEEPFPIPADDVLKEMSLKNLSRLYHRFVDNVGVLCRNINRLGKLTDGGWEVCHDQRYRPPSECLVYSVGINNDFSFDDAIAREYGCEVHSFDPSMKTKSYRRSEKVSFHQIGISDTDVHIPEGQTGWEMRKLGSMKQELGHDKRRINVLKMDIEHWEWKVLPEAIATGFLDDVTTLDLELHSWIIEKGTYIYEPPAEIYMGYLKSLRQLHQLGFRIYLTHKNLGSCQFKSKFGMMRTSCQEIAMVQTKKRGL